MYPPIPGQIGSTEPVTWFVAHTLLVVACLGTAVYARANEQYSRYNPLMWRYIALSCLVGAVFGLIAIGESADIATFLGVTHAVVSAFRRLVQLFFIMLLALSMRELYVETPHTTVDEPGFSMSSLRRFESVFLVIIFVQFGIVIGFGLTKIAKLVHLFGSIAFTLYGVSFAQGIRSKGMTSGTVIDTIATYVIAVLLANGVASAIVIGDSVGIDATITASAVNVFTVMGATFLIVLLIRLKQTYEATSGYS